MGTEPPDWAEIPDDAQVAYDALLEVLDLSRVDLGRRLGSDMTTEWLRIDGMSLSPRAAVRFAAWKRALPDERIEVCGGSPILVLEDAHPIYHVDVHYNLPGLPAGITTPCCQNLSVASKRKNGTVRCLICNRILE